MTGDALRRVTPPLRLPGPADEGPRAQIENIIKVGSPKLTDPHHPTLATPQHAKRTLSPPGDQASIRSKISSLTSALL